MRLKKGPLLMAVFVISSVVAVVLGVSMLSQQGVLPVIGLLAAGVGAGASASGIIAAMRRVMSRTPTRARGVRRRPPTKRERQVRPGATARPTDESAARVAGKVKWFNETKGFGFITPDDGSKDYFVHRSSIEGSEALPEGAAVEFESVQDEKGRRAAGSVRLVGGGGRKSDKRGNGRTARR